jgi:predicted dehydrogenase
VNLRIALVGTGAMAEYHYRKFSAIPGVSIPACADHRVGRAESFAARYGIPRRYDRIAGLLDSTGCGASQGSSGGTEIDAVSCAVVDRHHPRIALACLERGIALFCEKPMARTLAEARAMDAARPAGLPVLVNFSKRNAPALVSLAELVREGSLGTLQEIDASYSQGWLATGSWGDWRTSSTRRWRLSPAESTAGVLGDLGSHLLDAILAVTGGLIVDPVLVGSTDFAEAYARGMLGPARGEDSGDPLLGAPEGSAGESCPALVEFSAEAKLGGCALRIRASFVDASSVDAFAITIRGSLGTARLDLGASRSAVELETGGRKEWIEGRRLPSTYEAFVALVRGEIPALEGPAWMRDWSAPSFAEGLAVQRTLESLMDHVRLRHGAGEGALG